jgi:peptidyl-prolyl cis-trans isomerase C
MKILGIPFLFSVLLCGHVLYGQVQPPVNVTPGAPAIQAPVQIPPPSAAGTSPAQLPPDTVVAEVNGKKYTAADLDKLIATLPTQFQQAARAQPQALSQFFLLQRLTADAEKAGLDQRSPFKEQLDFDRIRVLSTAELTDIGNNMQITEDEEQKYYKDNPDKFKQVKVRVIQIAFQTASGKNADGKKGITEAEAKAKIEDLAKQIQAGADFGKLAHDVSDDKPSAAANGDFGVIKPDSTYPPAFITAVFALKQGEVSAPIQQPNGFYLIRAEEISQQSFQDSRVQLSQIVRQAKYQEWLKGIQAQYSVKIENPAYFSQRGAPAPVQQVH